MYAPHSQFQLRSALINFVKSVVVLIAIVVVVAVVVVHLFEDSATILPRPQSCLKMFPSDV